MASARHSKREQALRQLRAELASGRYGAGALLPPEEEWRALLGISRNTLREAVSVLVQEGLLERRQGSGTRVRDARHRTLKTCLLIVRGDGDLYERQAHLLQWELQRRGVLPLLAALGTNTLPAAPSLPACLEYALAHGVHGLITDGLPTEVQPYLGALPTVIINTCDPRLTTPAHRVLADHYRGAFLATRHLRALGHERILAIIHRNLYLRPGETVAQATGLYGDLIRGYHDGLDGVAPRYHFLDREFLHPQDLEGFRQQLLGPCPPTAIFAIGDYRAKVAIDLARQFGLRVPEDLAVVGYGNTPWATLGSLPMTTVEHHYERIAELAVEQLFGTVPDGHAVATRIIEPELVVRSSCGANLGSVTLPLPLARQA